MEGIRAVGTTKNGTLNNVKDIVPPADSRPSTAWLSRHNLHLPTAHIISTQFGFLGGGNASHRDANVRYINERQDKHTLNASSQQPISNCSTARLPRQSLHLSNYRNILTHMYLLVGGISAYATPKNGTSTIGAVENGQNDRPASLFLAVRPLGCHGKLYLTNTHNIPTKKSS